MQHPEPGSKVAALSIIDVVLKHRDAVQVAGAIPIGLLATIVHQPHPGDDREQAFVVAGARGRRLLTWRTTSPATGSAGRTAFVVRPLSPEEWRDLLDESVSVRQLLANDVDAARVVFDRTLDGSRLLIAPTTVGTEVAGADLPDEFETGPDGKRQRKRCAWLGRPKGTLVPADQADERAAALDPSAAPPSSDVAQGDDESTVVRSGLHVVTTRGDAVEVRRYRRQIDAMLAVERAALR